MGSMSHTEDVTGPTASEALGEPPSPAEEIGRLRKELEAVTLELDMAQGALQDLHGLQDELERLEGQVDGFEVLDVASRLHDRQKHGGPFRLCFNPACDEWRFFARSKGWEWG